MTSTNQNKQLLIQENRFETLDIDAGEELIIIDQYRHGTGKKLIRVGEGATLTYLVLIKNDVELDLHIESAGESANIIVKSLIVSDADSAITFKAHAHLKHDHAQANLHLITFLKEGAKANIDGGVDLHPDVKKVAGHLLEENIVLGEQVQIRALPMLDVRSSDVSASHGCRIQKLDEKKLFYMRSKGLNESEAKRLMLEGYVRDTFSVVKTEGKENSDIDLLEENWLSEVLK